MVVVVDVAVGVAAIGAGGGDGVVVVGDGGGVVVVVVGCVVGDVFIADVVDGNVIVIVMVRVVVVVVVGVDSTVGWLLSLLLLLRSLL